MKVQWIFYMLQKGGTHLDRKYIEAVRPLANHILQVDFLSGSRLLLDMNPHLDKMRFCALSKTPPNLSNSVLTAPSTFQTSPERFWIANVRKPICRLLSNAAIVVGPAILTL